MEGGSQHERTSIARHLKSWGLNDGDEQLLILNVAQHGLAVTVMQQFARL